MIVEDPLTAPGMVPLGVCPSGRASSEQAEEGVLLKVRGKCTDADTTAYAQTRIPSLIVPDGELRLEFKVVTGVERVTMVIFARTGDSLANAYAFSWTLAGLRAAIGKNEGGTTTNLAQQIALARLFRPGDWNTMAVRMGGPRLWLVLNEVAVASAVDASFETGNVWLRLVRTGNPADDQETAVVIRNLRVSALAGGDGARAPSYPPTTPPELGPVVVEDAFAAGETFPVGVSPSRRCFIEHGADGRVLRGSGRCGEGDPQVVVASVVRGITFGDGELRVESRVLGGASRVVIGIHFRYSAESNSGYYAAITPGGGGAFLGVFQSGRSTELGRRTWLAASMAADGWNSIAVRAAGPNLFLLVNDQLVLSATDATVDRGGVRLYIQRLGNVDDDVEVSAVVKNFKVSALADGDPARAPTFQAP